LEVGCGGGHLTADLAGAADRLTAIDPCVDALKSARRFVELPVAFASASGESLPIAGNRIDTVVFSLSLHHQDPHRALGEARRVLKQGGQILVLEPETDSLVTGLFAVLDDESWKYTLVEEAIEESGLNVFRSGSVKPWWVFEDFDEMVFYLFEYFGLERDREKVDRMAQLLGGRRGMKPLAIEDITRFWVLREP
jgi:SAM-dependent methyltransferase